MRFADLNALDDLYANDVEDVAVDAVTVGLRYEDDAIVGEFLQLDDAEPTPGVVCVFVHDIARVHVFHSDLHDLDHLALHKVLVGSGGDELRFFDSDGPYGLLFLGYR